VSDTRILLQLTTYKSGVGHKGFITVHVACPMSTSNPKTLQLDVMIISTGERHTFIYIKCT